VSYSDDPSASVARFRAVLEEREMERANMHKRLAAATSLQEYLEIKWAYAASPEQQTANKR
jgi:hypothetical protein